jgi:hypothetical protein
MRRCSHRAGIDTLGKLPSADQARADRHPILPVCQGTGHFDSTTADAALGRPAPWVDALRTSTVPRFQSIAMNGSGPCNRGDDDLKDSRRRFPRTGSPPSLSTRRHFYCLSEPRARRPKRQRFGGRAWGFPFAVSRPDDITVGADWLAVFAARSPRGEPQALREVKAGGGGRTHLVLFTKQVHDRSATPASGRTIAPCDKYDSGSDGCQLASDALVNPGGRGQWTMARILNSLVPRGAFTLTVSPTRAFIRASPIGLLTETFITSSLLGMASPTSRTTSSLSS